MNFSSWHPSLPCYSGNRQALAARINARNPCICQSPNVFWFYNPTRLSESATARTFAHSSQIHHPSISKLGGQCNIYRILPILLYFAVRSPGYSQWVISQILQNGPKIFGNLVVLIKFQKLVVEPLRILASRFVALFLFMCLAIIFGIGKSIGK